MAGLGIVCVYETKKNLFKRVEPRDPTLDRIPPSDCSFEDIIKFAATYDGYSQIAQEPENLVALYEPIRTEWRRSGSLPSWMGVDLLRGLLFFMYREDRWTGGFPYSSEEEKIEHQRPFREVLEVIREKLDV